MSTTIQRILGEEVTTAGGPLEAFWSAVELLEPARGSVKLGLDSTQAIVSRVKACETVFQDPHVTKYADALIRHVTWLGNQAKSLDDYNPNHDSDVNDFYMAMLQVLNTRGLLLPQDLINVIQDGVVTVRTPTFIESVFKTRASEAVEQAIATNKVDHTFSDMGRFSSWYLRYHPGAKIEWATKGWLDWTEV